MKPERWAIPSEAVRMSDLVGGLSEWGRSGNIVQRFDMPIPGQDEDVVNSVVTMLVAESAYSSADVVQDGRFFVLSHTGTEQDAKTLNCLRAMRDLAYVVSGSDEASQSSWQLTVAGRNLLVLYQQLRRIGSCLATAPLGDDPEKIYSAGVWELLHHLYASGWQVEVCKPRTKSRTLSAYCIEPTGEGAGSSVSKMYVKEKGKSISRQYLILLAAAHPLRLKKQIPHLASSEFYLSLMDVAYPHHATEERLKLLAIQDLEADSDIMKLLDTVPDPQNEEADAVMLAIDLPGDFHHDSDSVHEEMDTPSSSSSESESDHGDDPGPGGADEGSGTGGDSGGPSAPPEPPEPPEVPPRPLPKAGAAPGWGGTKAPSSTRCSPHTSIVHVGAIPNDAPTQDREEQVGFLAVHMPIPCAGSENQMHTNIFYSERQEGGRRARPDALVVLGCPSSTTQVKGDPSESLGEGERLAEVIQNIE